MTTAMELISVFSPSVALYLGDPGGMRTVSLLYAASVQAPSHGQSPFNQTLSLSSQFQFARTSIGVGIDFSGLTGLNRDAGGDTKRNILTLSLTSTYRYSSKSSLEADFTIPVSQFSDGISSSGVTASFFYNYMYSAKTTIGTGVTLGLLDVDGGGSQHYLDPTVRVNYQADEKLSFNANVGLDIRDAGPSTSINPIFGLGVSWKAREGTIWQLTGQGSVQNSDSLQGANFTSTSLALSLTQTIARVFTGTASLGFEQARYYSVQQGVSTNRNDFSYFLQLGVSTQLGRYWSTSLIVSGGDTISNTDPLRYLQTSLQFNYLF